MFHPLLSLELDDGDREAIRADLAEAAPLSAYPVRGVGYSRSWDRIGRLVFAYGDADTAAADLPGRRYLAETGDSPRTGQPYAESVFVVSHAAATDGTILLEVEPAADMPRRSFDMVISRDMLCAACTG